MNLLLATVITFTATSEPPPRVVREAQAHVKLGDKYFDAREWERAIAEYQSALALVENATLVWNVARAYEEKGDVALATAFLERFLTLSISHDERDRATRRLSALRSTPIKRRDAEADVDRRERALSAESLPVVVVPARSTATTWGWTTLGLGAAIAATGGVVLGLGVRRYDDVHADASSHVADLTRQEAQTIQDDGDRRVTSGLVLLAVGGAAVAAGIVVLATRHDARVGFAPLDGGGALVGVSGTW